MRAPRLGGFPPGVLLLAVVALLINGACYVMAQRGCDGVLVRDYFGFPACVQTPTPEGARAR